MQVGFICSSGGSALFSAISLFTASSDRTLIPVIVTDRECGARHKAMANGFATRLVPFETKERFSSESAQYFHTKGVTNILLFYTRLIGRPLIDEFNVFNIHPSLLPSYKGIGAVEMAKTNGGLLLGATLHEVEIGMDSGPLKHQVATAGLNRISSALANKLSYLQKVWLALNWLEEQVNENLRPPDLSTPLRSVSTATRNLSLATLEKFIAFEAHEIGLLGEGY